MSKELIERLRLMSADTYGNDAADALESLEADRDSWERQAGDRLDDVLRVVAERDALAAELKALQDSIKPIHVDFDDALNDAGWKFIEYFNNDIPAHVFNWCKPALKLCIEAWLDRRGLSVCRLPPDHAIATALMGESDV